uniref:hypothetical protein n=1 Tax=Nonomuraea sp. CA-251285 TaxID=3240002 RepID=UPI003F49507E
MRQTNIASGNDRVAVQVGEIHPADPSQEGPPPPEPLHDQAAPGDPAEHAVHNMAFDNAKVGVQTDVYVGDLNIQM